ncbi:response regulator transcription factor [Streptomyces sp. LHD-70]|uniref:response regulator transcription factor n=1 Tax=Streptomyces sp. LHD-70 TaxID=3072140 RepID=UPI00280EC6EF|nr:response regulator transcription factor [Streptomyces sp. LHD-70]MDQ8706925.1 response regulator transcription factor [Streptomyces sp. LHD-70]
MNVLIVEDDDGVAEALEQTLEVHGHQAHRVCTGTEALGRLDGAELVLLDLGLPDLEGHEVCRRIRERSCVPVIALSGRTEELDRVMALHLGADDFMPKPVGRYELIARIQAVSRRAGGCAQHAAALVPATAVPAAPAAPTAPPLGGPAPVPLPGPVSGPVSVPTPRPAPVAALPAPVAAPMSAPAAAVSGATTAVPAAGPEAPAGAGGPLRAGPLRLDPRTRKVFLNDAEVRITRKEFNLLAMLMEDPGTVMERQDIMARVWDENWFGSTRTLDVHVGSLRAKLGSTEWIETVRGVGYRMTVPDAAYV